jgi:hypothetical protein
MLVKMIIIFFILIILYSLASALFYLVRGQNHSIRGVKALTWRISLSLLLFFLLFMAYALGWVTPHPV